jgi:hypothetical protein
MKRQLKSWMWVMGVMVVAAMLVVPAVYAADQPAPAKPDPAATAKMKPAAEKLTVTGTVTETKDAKGRASYALDTDQGNFVLSKHAKGVELRKLIGKKVEATGTIMESHGKKVITVTEYKEIQ